MIRLGATLVLFATLAILAAGCGASAEEEWAADVCSAVSEWQNQVEESAGDVSEQLQSPGAGTLAAIDAEIQEAVDATEKLGDELNELEPPDSEAGDQAQQDLDALTVQLDSTVTDTKETVDSLPEDASFSQLAETLAPLAPSLRSLAVSVSSTLESVQERGSEIKEGFDEADSCEDFR